MSRLFVLDAMALAYRAYYAFIRRPLVNSKGENTSAIFGFTSTALKIRREERPDFWALAWDGPGPTFRHERYAEYKATRKPMPEDLPHQLSAIEDVAQALGLPVLEIPGMEADDVMGSLARRAEDAGHEAVIVTGDKDLLQLVNPRVRVLAPVARGEDYEWMDAAAVEAKWGVAPEQIRDVLALMGDAVDHVPGVPGVGEKTAVELIRQFGSLEQLYQRLDEVKRPALKAKLETHRAMAELSRELVTVRTDCALPVTVEDLRCRPFRRDTLRELAARWEIHRLRQVAEAEGMSDAEAGDAAHARAPERRGPERPAAPVRERPITLAPAPPPVGVEAIHLPPVTAAAEAAAPAEAPAATAVAPQGALDLWAGSAAAGDALLATWTAALHEVRARAIHGLALLPFTAHGPEPGGVLVGLALAARDGTAAYVPIAHEAGPNVPLSRVRGWLAPALADAGVPKTAHDLKDVSHVLAAAGMPVEGLALDVHLLSFLLDPERDHGLPALARDVLGWKLPPLELPAARGRPRPSWAALPAEAAHPALTARVAALHPIAAALETQLAAREQWPLYTQLERPLVAVLLDMERTGVALDRAVLAEMSAAAGAEIARLEQALHALAGEPINLGSGPQLARILFEKLGLKPKRRTKTGLSTDQAVLEELAGEHAFPRLLLEWRALAKLKSTYLDALPVVANPRDGRVHTTFHQAGAATGRLSSSDPNLQNIPMRTAQGRAIRRAFVAPPGRLLVSADYSQIELRIMAHLSGDAALIDAFAAGEDVHAATARRVFALPAGAALDPGQRARAKVVNFGIMYGMGARTLAQQMGASPAEAEAFIRDYFRAYAGVRAFLDRTLEEGREKGFVQTLLGRRRWLPALTSVHGGERALAERAAINTPIQGSAADIVKLAMIRVHAALKRSHPSARLLLQVHDELLVEADAADAGAVGEVLAAEMRGVQQLRVPLEVSVGSGPTWLDAH